MKLIDLLNTANCGKKLPMYVWDCYSDSGFKKRVKFFLKSFGSSDFARIMKYKETNELKREMLTISSIKQDGQYLYFNILLDCGDIIEHKEYINCIMTYDTILLNHDFVIIGAAKYDITSHSGAIYQPYLFSDLTNNE